MAVDPRVPVAQVTGQAEPVPAAVGAERLDDATVDIRAKAPPQSRHTIVERGPEHEVGPRHDLRSLRRAEIQVGVVGIAEDFMSHGREGLVSGPAPRGLLAQQEQSVRGLVDARRVGGQRGGHGCCRRTAPQLAGRGLVGSPSPVTPEAGVVRQQGLRPRLGAVGVRLGQDRLHRGGVTGLPRLACRQLRYAGPLPRRRHCLGTTFRPYRHPPLGEPHPSSLRLAIACPGTVAGDRERPASAAGTVGDRSVMP